MTLDESPFRVGMRFQIAGQEYVLSKRLGEGGQGEVWLVSGKQSANAAPTGRSVPGAFAMKWYNSMAASPRQFEILRRLVSAPPPDVRFLWPLALVQMGGIPRFGYLMHVREDRFKDLTKMMNGEFAVSPRRLMNACMQLADSFFRLHARGMSYCDISYGNVFVDPDSGEILICDNDNVIVNNTGLTGTTGTPSFVAPEIVRGEVQQPNTATDRFSLAVLLFAMIVMHHPFEGRMYDEIPGFVPDKDQQIYGTPAPFIFHPVDDSNHLPPEYAGPIARWNLLPKFLRRRFVEAFVDTVNKPQSRVVETIWRSDFLRTHDSIHACPGCGAENYYDRESCDPNGTVMGDCWRCKQPIPMPPRLGLKRGDETRVVVAGAGTKLYPIHIGSDAQAQVWELRTPLAQVESAPNNPQQLGLRNLSTATWMASMPDGRLLDIAPGKIVGIRQGVTVQFGPVFGQFRVTG
jgi:DNA-binding helix-hairpin-helix protein with protein kinase domain